MLTIIKRHSATVDANNRPGDERQQWLFGELKRIACVTIQAKTTATPHVLHARLVHPNVMRQLPVTLTP